jgi:methylated-DNA-[protein]-cysteine S-methyltransferase
LQQRGVFSTSWGNIELIWSEKGISYLSFPNNQSLYFFKEPLGLIKEVKNAMEEYFKGNLKVFHFEVNLSGLTLFQQKVLRMVETIPYGETRSYKWVAEQIGCSGYRAVGRAMGSNPVPIIIP